MEAPDVHLESLNAERVRPARANAICSASSRKRRRHRRPRRRSRCSRRRPSTRCRSHRRGPPPLPPIALKFIGIIESPTHARKIAVLSDGRNPPFQGEEGAIIEGRYRILKIGVESIELAYVDGRGRQTIRLTGS
jgi:hypothetical protein